MSLILITGTNGAGKSAVYRELNARGFEAYGSDENQLAGWVDKTTQLPVSMPPREIWAKPEWAEQNDWRFDRGKLEVLAERARARAQKIFICGCAANEAEVWDLFSKVLYLIIDEDTVRQRLSARIENQYGKEPHELSAILSWLRNARADYTRFGAEIVDASRPLVEVVDEILSLVRADDNADACP
jgi:shikimate kinase